MVVIGTSGSKKGLLSCRIDFPAFGKDCFIAFDEDHLRQAFVQPASRCDSSFSVHSWEKIGCWSLELAGFETTHYHVFGRVLNKRGTLLATAQNKNKSATTSPLVAFTHPYVFQLPPTFFVVGTLCFLQVSPSMAKNTSASSRNQGSSQQSVWHDNCHIASHSIANV